MAEIELSMGYMLNWGARLVRRLADRRLKSLGLSAGHLPVINALAEYGVTHIDMPATPQSVWRAIHG